MKLPNLKKLSQNPNLKQLLDLKNITDSILQNRYFTYFIAVITLVIISETFRNPDLKVLLLLKDILNITTIKLLVILLGLYVGIYNQVLGILILLNLFFITNIREKIEFFVNNLPDLVDKNKALQYEKKFKSPIGDRKIQDNMKKTKTKTESTEKESSKQESSKKSNPNDINGIIKIQKTTELVGDSIDDKYEEKIEKEVDNITKKIDDNELDTSDFDTDVDDSLKDKKKKAMYLKYYKKNHKNKKNKLDERDFAERGTKEMISTKSLEEHTERKDKKSKYKEDLINELKAIEKEELEQNVEKNNKDKTLETEIKQANYEKRRNLEILEDEDEESSSSDSSDSSSSSESSSESDKEYEDVSLTEAREHVLKKLRNKMKKDYVNDK